MSFALRNFPWRWSNSARLYGHNVSLIHPVQFGKNGGGFADEILRFWQIAFHLAHLAQI